MKIPIGIAQKLVQLMGGEVLPASQLKHRVIAKMLEDGVLQVRTIGRSKKQFFIADATHFSNYLKNNFGINDLPQYIYTLENEGTRADAILASSDSKTRRIRTFKGFLLNAYQAVPATLNGREYIIDSKAGAFTYIYDFEHFSLAPDITIVGVENAENFRFIEEQAYLFYSINPLFVSRYPQSNDLISWLKGIPNNYLHFGDFDFAGINIFKHEFQQYLGKRASFFIPENIERLIVEYGNRDLYDKQLKLETKQPLSRGIEHLKGLFHNHKKCLEQEILINKV